jgi:hypothetical protein
LKFDLFLDPPIVEINQLEAELKNKIKEWNKKTNFDLKWKSMVETASKLLNDKSGLTPDLLAKLAHEAREYKLKQLRENIEEYESNDVVTESNYEEIKRNFSCFREETIKDNFSMPIVPAFSPPPQPKELQLPQGCKEISVTEMDEIDGWLQIIENGKYKNLYGILDLNTSSEVEILRKTANNAAEKNRRFSVKTAEVDAKNKLFGKAANFFKDTESKKSYDFALQRQPFNKLCKDKFEKRCNNKKISQRNYNRSVEDTMKAGYSREESEWLVFDYYCNKKKCSPPLNSVPQSLTPNQQQKSVENKPQSYNNSNHSPSSTSPVHTASVELPQALKNIGKIFDAVRLFLLYLFMGIKSVNEKYKKKQFYNENFGSAFRTKIADNDMNIFYNIRSRELSLGTYSHQRLCEIFEALDSLADQFRSNPNIYFDEIISLRAQVASVLADLDYENKILDRALRCCNAILEKKPDDELILTRKNLILDTKNQIYNKLDNAVAEENIINAYSLIDELKSKFPTCPETAEHLNNVENKLDQILINPDHFKQLFKDKKWFQIIRIVNNNNGDPKISSYMKGVEEIRKKASNADHYVQNIRSYLYSEDFGNATIQLDKLEKHFPDHPEIDMLRKELIFVRDSYSKVNSRIQNFCKQRRWLAAENIARDFLASNHVTCIGLLGIVRDISHGVNCICNRLSFQIFNVIGGGIFVFLFWVSYLLVVEKQSIQILNQFYLSDWIAEFDLAVTFIVGILATVIVFRIIFSALGKHLPDLIELVLNSILVFICCFTVCIIFGLIAGIIGNLPQASDVDLGSVKYLLKTTQILASFISIYALIIFTPIWIFYFTIQKIADGNLKVPPLTLNIFIALFLFSYAVTADIISYEIVKETCRNIQILLTFGIILASLLVLFGNIKAQNHIFWNPLTTIILWSIITSVMIGVGISDDNDSENLRMIVLMIALFILGCLIADEKSTGNIVAVGIIAALISFVGSPYIMFLLSSVETTIILCSVGIWCAVTLSVFIFCNNSLNAPICFQNIIDIFERRQLLLQLEESDFGNKSLLSTKWYNELVVKEQLYRVDRLLSHRTPQQSRKRPPKLPPIPSLTQTTNSLESITLDPNADWYIYRHDLGVKWGPFKIVEIKKLVREKQITSSTLLWRAGQKKWLNANKFFPELNDK